MRALFDLHGHVALVTGGNSGIGLGMAEALAGQGATVAIWGTNSSKNEAAAAQLRALGHEVFNPAEKDIERHGTDISKGNVAGDEAKAAADHGFNLRQALGEDLAWICEHAEGVALLLVEQNVVQSLDVAQRAYILDNGRFVLEGSAETIRDDPALKRAYLGM